MPKTNLKKIATPRETILAALVFLVVLVLFFKMLYAPYSEKIKTLKEQVATVKLEKRGLELENEALTRREKTAQLAAEKKKPNTKMEILQGGGDAGIKDVAELVETVTSSPFQQGITLDSLSYKTAQEHTGYSQIPLIISAAGPFHRLTTFLEKLDQMAALVSLDAIHLYADPEKGGEMNLEITANFYQLEGLHAATTQKK